MRYINPRSIEDALRKRAYEFQGRVVKTTDGRTGLVVATWIHRDEIRLQVLDSETREHFTTSNEYAVIQRDK